MIMRRLKREGYWGNLREWFYNNNINPLRTPVFPKRDSIQCDGYVRVAGSPWGGSTVKGLLWGVCVSGSSDQFAIGKCLLNG
jgi:hypothetical protein